MGLLDTVLTMLPDKVFNHVLDLHFVVSDLKDIVQTKSEISRSSFYDAQSIYEIDHDHSQDERPMGKRVY